LGFIFFIRHALAKCFFPEIVFGGSDFTPKGMFLRSAYVQLLPLILIILSIAAAFQYQSTYRSSLLVAQAEHAAALQGGQLANAYLQEIREAPTSSGKLAIAEEFISTAQLISSTDPNGLNALALGMAYDAYQRGPIRPGVELTPVQLQSESFRRSIDWVNEFEAEGPLKAEGRPKAE